MKEFTSQMEKIAAKPICVGLTCWRWQRGRAKAISEIAQRAGVTLKLTETIRGLHREISAEVSGRNVDRFIGEFARDA
jgi:hypothetical protein